MNENVIAGTEQELRKRDACTGQDEAGHFNQWGFYFLLACFLVSCSNPRTEWYEVTGCSDLSLIPLIKPYQLFTSVADDSIWFFSFVNNGKLDGCGNNYDNQMPVSWINVKSDIIYGYSDKFSDYFVVIPSRKIEKKFSKKNEWLLYLNEIHQDTDTFYRPDRLYKNFDSDHSIFGRGKYKALPWYNQIKDIIK